MRKSNVFGRMLGVAILAMMTIPSFASGRVVVGNYMDTEYAVVSAVLSPEESYRVLIRDANGMNLYSSEKISNSLSFQKILDLSQLEDGKYQLVIDGTENDLVSSFSVKGRKLVVSRSSGDVEIKSETFTTAFVRQSNDLLYVTHINPELKMSSLEITNEFGEQIYSSQLPSSATYSGMFKISSLPKGNYLLTLTAGSKSYNYEFSKER